MPGVMVMHERIAKWKAAYKKEDADGKHHRKRLLKNVFLILAILLIGLLSLVFIFTYGKGLTTGQAVGGCMDRLTNQRIDCQLLLDSCNLGKSEFCKEAISCFDKVLANAQKCSY
jgi:hypothetical protein